MVLVIVILVVVIVTLVYALDGENLMIFSPPRSDSLWSGLKFYRTCLFIFFQRKISEMRRPIDVKFCTVVITRLNFIMPFQNFGGLTL